MTSRRSPKPDTLHAPKAVNRTFSKKLTGWSVAALIIVAFYGVSAGFADTAKVVSELGIALAAQSLLYMGIGWLDLRTALGRSFGEIIAGYFGGRRKRPDGDAS